jgi:D-inositol-3-phosphate glycosyltransferase
MNVYVHEVATEMERRGVAVDVFTRRSDRDVPAVVRAGYRVIHVDAGPPEPLPITKLADFVGAFAEGVVAREARAGAEYDLVHSHYWLSGWAGVLIGEVLEIPLAISFHTLGRVKDASRRDDEAPTSLLRIAAETEVIARAGCVVASTPAEAEELMEHYAARPERLCVSPPGVDHSVFCPGSRGEARAELGLPDGPLVLFVGRIQPLKGIDVAVAAFADVAAAVPGVRLLVVGGPSGPQGNSEMARLSAMASEFGVADRIEVRGPMPHRELATVYRSADVLLVPSRSESFGLVAVEAQACALPVVAAEVGGLAHTVVDGESGFLVSGWNPAGYAEAVRRILDDTKTAARLSRGALAHAETFSWSASTQRLLELYEGITAG